MTLHTRRFFKRQEIKILRSSLKIEKRSLLDSIEYEVPFENIHNKKRIQTNTNDNLLVIAFFLLIIGLLFLFGSNSEISSIALIGGTFFLTLALITRKKTVTILTYDGNNIELPFNQKNKPEVLEFSNKIIDASNHFLLNKYSKIDKSLPVEGQLSKLEYLRDREILTDEDFENLKNQLVGKDNKGSIGFGR
jgi:hypothetical protein